MKGCVARPLLQQNKKYTFDDIYALPDGQRAKLIDGRMCMMAPPTRKHQQILGALYRKILNYINQKCVSCEVDLAPFTVFLNADDKTYVEPDINIICNPDKFTAKGCTGSPDWIIAIISQVTGEWIITPNCSNTVLQVFTNTRLLTLRKIESQFIRLDSTILQNIPFPKLSKPESMMICRLVSSQ